MFELMLRKKIVYFLCAYTKYFNISTSAADASLYFHIKVSNYYLIYVYLFMAKLGYQLGNIEIHVFFWLLLL